MAFPYVGVGQAGIIRSGPRPVNASRPGSPGLRYGPGERQTERGIRAGTKPAGPRSIERPHPAAGAAARMGENELDLELVKRVQRGEKSAFDLLVLKYQHRIGAVIGRFVPDHAEA